MLVFRAELSRAFAGAALAAAVALSSSAPLRAADMSPAELLIKAGDASGIDHWPATDREEWDAVESGQPGVRSYLRRGRNYVMRTQIGPIVTETGEYEMQAWHRDENGITVLERTPLETQIDAVTSPLTEEDAVAISVAHVTTPGDFYVLRRELRDGDERAVYYDAKTFLIARIDIRFNKRTFFCRYDDYRKDASGRTRAWHMWGGSDNPADAFDFKLRSDSNAAVADSELAVPPHRRAFVEFPAGADSVRLPARIDHRGNIIVRVVIGGRGFDLELDSGAASITLNAPIVAELGLPTYRHQYLNGKVESRAAVVPQMSVGSLTMHDVAIDTAPVDENVSDDTRVVGLLGFDFLAEAAVRIDYQHGIVDAYRPSRFVPPAKAEELAVRLDEQTPQATVTINGRPSDVLLDTGAEFEFVLSHRYFRARESGATPAPIPLMGDSQPVETIAGQTEFKRVKVSAIDIGTLELQGALGYVATDPADMSQEDAVIGSGILGLFTFYLDFAHNRVFFEQPSP